MATTFILKGSNVTDPTNNNFGRAHFVRVNATTDGALITVKDSDGNTLGTMTFTKAGDSVIIEKSPSDTITVDHAYCSAVGSPRS
jgi:hypothetical protein